MAKNLKFGFMIFIIGAAVTGAYFIVKNSVPGIAQKENFQSEKLAESTLPGNPLEEPSETASNSGGVNLTELIGGATFNEVKAKSLGDSFSNEKLLSARTMDAVLQSTQLNLISYIGDSEINISEDNSKEAKINYLNAIGNINKRYASQAKTYLEIMVDVFQKLESDSALKAGTVFYGMAKEYQNLTVPSDWKEFHKQAVVVFKNAGVAYEAMSAYKDDPIKGYFAMEAVESISAEGEGINKMLVQKAKEVGY